MTDAKKLIAIIRYILHPGVPLPDFAVEDWETLTALAKKNGVFQYVYRYMKRLPEEKKPSAELAAAMEKRNAVELRTGVLQEQAAAQLQSGLEKAGIDHLFMKGTVTKKRYPDAFLRTMGDIDFLYNVAQHDKMPAAMEAAGFVLKSVGRVHDLYTDRFGGLLEAHRQLMSSGSPFCSFGEGIWDRAVRQEGTSHCYAMTAEDEFLFNFIHLTSHFKKGGVGLRFIVDVWIYRQLSLDWDAVEEQLSKMELLPFYRAVAALAEKWFGTPGKEDALVDEIEEYILSGGIFGSRKNRQNAAIRNGRFRQFFKACFPNYGQMQSMFPWLKSRLLLPAAWVLRIFGSLTKRRRNIAVALSPAKNGDAAAAAELKRFYERCGLKD